MPMISYTFEDVPLSWYVIETQQQPQVILVYYTFLDNFLYEIHSFIIKCFKTYWYVGGYVIHSFIRSFIFLFLKYLLNFYDIQAFF